MIKYTLRGALLIKGEKDLLQWKNDKPLQINVEGWLYCTETGIGFTPKPEHIVQANWQILKPEPKVLSAEEIVNNYGGPCKRTGKCDYNDALRIAEESLENGRLERDLEVRDLITAVTCPQEHDITLGKWYDKVIKEAQKLKPLYPLKEI